MSATLEALGGVVRRVWKDPLARGAFAAFCVFLAIFAPPRIVIGVDADSSWRAVLEYAWGAGWQFGEGVSFTYGPLGFLWTPFFSSTSAVAGLLNQAVVCLAAASGACWLGWRLRPAPRGLFLFGFAYLTVAINASGDYHLGYDLLFYDSILFWSILCLGATGRRQRLAAAVFTLFAVWSALGKLTFFYIDCVGIALVSLSLAAQGARRLGAAVLGAFAAGVVLLWLCLGQNLVSGWYFLRNGALLTQGYAEAMSNPCSPTLRFWMTTACFLTAAAWAAVAVAEVLSRRTGRRARIPLWLWLGILGFVACKHGQTRADLVHVGALLAFLPVLSAAMALLAPSRWLKALSAVLALSCAALCAFTLQWLVLPGNLGESLHRPFHQIGSNLSLAVCPNTYFAPLKAEEANQRQRAALPTIRKVVGDSPVDVFGFGQSYAIFNGLNYRPRPVFQSYAAFSRPLMELNERYYASAEAPDYVLFKLLPIDRRFPPLEDAWVLRHLLLSYQLIGEESPFLLLNRQSNNTANLRLIGEETIRLGERMDLTRYGKNPLWVELEAKISDRGWIQQTLGRAPRLRLAIWPQATDPHPLRLNAPPAMIAAGFMLSPLILDNSTVTDFYAGKPLIHPECLAIEAGSGAAHVWEGAAHLRVYEAREFITR